MGDTSFSACGLGDRSAAEQAFWESHRAAYAAGKGTGGPSCAARRSGRSAGNAARPRAVLRTAAIGRQAAARRADGRSGSRRIRQPVPSGTPAGHRTSAQPPASNDRQGPDESAGTADGALSAQHQTRRGRPLEREAAQLRAALRCAAHAIGRRVRRGRKRGSIIRQERHPRHPPRQGQAAAQVAPGRAAGRGKCRRHRLRRAAQAGRCARAVIVRRRHGRSSAAARQVRCATAARGVRGARGATVGAGRRRATGFPCRRSRAVCAGRLRGLGREYGRRQSAAASARLGPTHGQREGRNQRQAVA